MDAREGACRIGPLVSGTAVIGVALLAPLSWARAEDYPLGEGKLSITGSMYVGTAIRTDRQDPKLLPDRNSSLVGIKGDAITPSLGRNQDDGNLNFSRGDAVSAPVKGFLALAYKWRNFGIEASAQGWYDYATADADHPWGHEPNDYAADEPLSDARADARTKFSGMALDSLYAYGHHDFPEHAFDWRLGYQSVDWGKRSLAVGGLRDLNPVDYPASVRPGALRDQETRVPMALALARVTLAKATSIEAYYELQFERSALNQCGTFVVQVDFLAPGCKKVMIGDVSDRTSIATGLYVKRGRTVDPPDDGQYGIALRHKVDDGATEFGLYAAQFHSRMAFYSGVTSQREGAPFIPGDPGDLNPTFYTEFPSSIRMFGASVESKLSRGLVYGEFTYRPNQPFQYNSLDALIAVVSRTLPTPLRDKANSKGPGGTVHAWERHEAVQLQLGAATEIPGALGSAGLGLLGELVYKQVPHLPDPSVTRFGRAEVFGQGPVDGVCPPPAAPVSCSFDGYVSRHAFGYRLRAGLRYPKAVAGVDLAPSIIFGHDVSGWSGDGWINEGRMLAIVSLQANFASHWSATIGWQPTWGGTYNNQRDRGVALANVGYQF